MILVKIGVIHRNVFGGTLFLRPRASECIFSMYCTILHTNKGGDRTWPDGTSSHTLLFLDLIIKGPHLELRCRVAESSVRHSLIRSRGLRTTPITASSRAILRSNRCGFAWVVVWFFDGLYSRQIVNYLLGVRRRLSQKLVLIPTLVHDNLCLRDCIRALITSCLWACTHKFHFTYGA